MPELVFKGKEYVYNHHLTVPYRPLVADSAKAIGPADLAGNLIIHGDNTTQGHLASRRIIKTRPIGVAQRD